MKASVLLYPLCMTLCLILSFAANAQEGQGEKKNEQSTIFNLMHYQELLEVELSFNFQDLEKHRRNEERFDALLRFVDGEGRPRMFEVELNVRGRYRRLHCNFPPLKINFDKDDLAAANLMDHNNLKLVSHCLNAAVGDDYVLREYLAYRLYEDLTHVSYRTQLVVMHYLDTHSDKSFMRFGILLEDEKELADRFDSELCEDCFGVEQEAYNPEAARLHDLFQYMIGNADYSPKILRNVKLLKPKNGDPYYLVPYDFDFTGFVNALYVQVPPHLGVDDIRDRVYLGFPHSAPDMEETFDFMQSRRNVLLDDIENFPYISKKTKRDLRDYIRSFFNRYRDASELETLASNPKDLIRQN